MIVSIVRSAVRLAGLPLVFAVLVTLFDYNRYWDYCSKREFHDSIGPLAHEGDRVSCRVENSSLRPIPPGKLPGHLFTSIERSQPAWILLGLLSCITAVANIVFISSQPNNKNNNNKESRSFSHHQSEYGRIGWIIYVCMAVIIVHQAINMAKVADCRPENGAEIFYIVMLVFDVSMQGKLYSSIDKYCMY